MSKPLSDVLVLDLSRVLAGPLATQQLADLGARVIKVESPTGDGTRGWGPPFWDEQRSGYFLACNRGKESLALDLADPRARSILDRWVTRADVVIENFRPGTLERWGWSLEKWRRQHDSLITCSITGFGTGTLREQHGGYDALIQAMSGFMSITGPADGPPSKVGVAVVDVLTGLNAANGILAALVGRARKGVSSRFRHVEVALSESALAGLVNVSACAVNELSTPKRWGNQHPTIVPYAPFTCVDGEVFIGVGTDAQWRSLARAFGRPDWEREEWGTNAGRVGDRDELQRQLSDEVSARRVVDVEELLAAARVPAGPIRTVAESLADPDVKTRAVVVEHADGTKTIASPVRFGTAAERSVADAAPPHLGQHTDALLRELGVSDDEIGELHNSGAVTGPRR